MKRILAGLFVASLLLFPVSVSAATDTSSKAPPVAQKIVREGDFAFSLATRLKLGNPKNEAEAEGLLVHAGIAPKNGWISDYPVTPEVMVQVQTSVKTSARAGRIRMKVADADKVVVGLGTELGIAVAAGAPPKSETAYAPPEGDVDVYYEDEGPPVVTYYAPPPDYYYLYDWEPWPFWWAGFWFPGFFVLADFDFVVVVNSPGVVVVGGNRVILSDDVVVHRSSSLTVTNHVMDPKTKTTVKLAPSGRFVSGTTAWHGDAVNFAKAPRPAGMTKLSRAEFTNRVKSGKGQAAILSRSTTRQGASSSLKGTRPSHAGKESGGHNAVVPSGRGHATGSAETPGSGFGRQAGIGRGAVSPEMSGGRPSGGPRMGSPRMGGMGPSGGGCRGRNC